MKKLFNLKPGGLLQNQTEINLHNYTMRVCIRAYERKYTGKKPRIIRRQLRKLRKKIY